MTRQEKQAAVASIYGVEGAILTPSPQFTQTEIEKMRALVAQSDRMQGGINSFDLNNPPKQPYVFRPFPAMLYDHESRKTLIVNSEAEMQDALADGWTKQPFEQEAGPGHVSAADLREAKRIDKQLKKKAD